MSEMAVNAHHDTESPSPSQQAATSSVGTTEPGGIPSAQSKLDPQDYSRTHASYPRISRPVELLRDTYDVVVIGSGYGGSVAASRMARAGQSVCVLERGRERWPGEYPDRLSDAAREISISGLFAPKDRPGRQISFGDPTKLYQLVLGAGQNAFVASGLGGTSLLNANVFLRADKGTMSLPEWAEDLREDDALEEYYSLAEQMLQPKPYPEDFPPLPKLELLERQGVLVTQEFANETRAGSEFNPKTAKFYRVPQTTRFEEGPNYAGVQMQASTLTGMDSTGVNDGSKSSTLVTYLSDAWNWGAEIFCECEARYVKKHPTQEGYLVYFAWHGSKRAKFEDNIYNDPMWVHAKKFVFFGAGALGTTEILLRSKSLGLKMNDRIGKDMSGNGDILAFGYNTNYDVNGMGMPFPPSEKPIGPTITGVIDCRHVNSNPLDGFVIEEGAITAVLVPVLQTILEALPGKIYPADFGVVSWLRGLAARLMSRVSNYWPSGSLERTQTYLIMSHDSNQARMTLEDGKVALRFLGVGRSEHTAYLNGILGKITGAVGGIYINNPFYASLGKQEITVHAIGGASMAAHATGASGATDSVGRVLRGQGGEVFDGLVVVDGAAVPTALGVNPLATITALAERSVRFAAERAGITIDYDSRNGTLDLFGQPRHFPQMAGNLKTAYDTIKAAAASDAQGIQFTEVMSGFITIEDEIEDFDIAYNAAASAGSSARFFLSVHAWDIDDLVGLENHPAMLTGTFTCAGLPGSPFMVLRGSFNLFTTDSRTPDTTNLNYDFDMISTRGETVHFNGYKVVDSSITLQPGQTWRAASTLYATLSRNATVIGRGRLNIQPPDFVSELKTFSPVGSNLLSRISSTSKFLTFFTKQIASKFFGSLGQEQWPTASTKGYKTSQQLPSNPIKITSSDGLVSTLQHWLPSSGAPPRVNLKVLFIPGAAVDHQIFALPTIDVNAVEYFQTRGFEVFCITLRVGKTPNAMREYTTFDARLDIRNAFEEIHKLQGSPAPIYVVAHCAGSVALSAGLLDGTIPAQWIQGLTASQVFFNPLFGAVNKLKACSPISMAWIYGTIVGQWFSCISTKHDTLVQRLLNQAAKLYPVGSAKEICNSVVCHWSELVFGRLWSHKRLNAATHSNLSKFLGGTSMKSLEHLMFMGTHGYVANNDRVSLVTNRNLDRLKGIPILFISGSDNVVFTPEATEQSFAILTHRFQQAGYEREVFEGYGHLDCWMSPDAAKDIYPTVYAHAARCAGMQRERRVGRE
ncbi:hypothetical protein LTS10_010840 [Elasticomyces elasticus]|nr:hypothetical protein LTS10_010840 [Elasticomyces elasticus]